MASIKKKFQVKKTPAADYLIVGLGNPGPEYVGTRHNIGADVVTQIATAADLRLRKSKSSALTAGLSVSGVKLGLAVPTTYMNESGLAVGALVRQFGISDFSKLVILHDELDLPVGSTRVKLGGGFAGHNGLKSINQHIKSPDFLRVRIGIDRPPTGGDVSSYVLSKPSKSQKSELQLGLVNAVGAVELIVSEGHDEAMRKYNSD